MVDLRERVEEDRGYLKKIQMYIPGFRGYRIREDIRQADGLLRIQLANKIRDTKTDLESCRKLMVSKYMTSQLEPLGGLINYMTKIDGEVRHAEQGYSGFSAAIQVKEEELDRLYEFDYSMINLIFGLKQRIDLLKEAIQRGNEMHVENELAALRTAMEDFENTFRRRMNVITGTEV